MKPKFLLIAAAAFLAAVVSCTDNMDVHYNVPYISMDQIKEQKGGVFEFWGECSAEDGIPGCEYFFLCSSSETDFSKADRIEAMYSKTEGYCDYRALYEPSAGGTFYVKFCADNNGLSYIESNVMNFEYKPVDYTSPVDLGLPSGVKWAQTNLGAKTPDEYGNYYAWGETVTKDIYSWDYYRHSAGGGDMLTKYCNKDGWGNKNFRDNITALELADDAARANLKDKWRIPSDGEFAELMEYCEWTWTKSENGVYGYEVKSFKNGNSIFLPAAGWYWDERYQEGMGSYWSNSLGSYPYRAGGIYFDKDFLYLSDTDDFHFRYLGLPVRPVYGDYVAVESVTVYPESSTVELGGKVQLTATVSPLNATNKGVTWVSVDTKVATVSESGLVTGVSAGTAYIKAVATDGKTFAQCTVKVEPCVAVDLGLPSGLKWASCNVGATKPEEYGGYYAWGELKEKTIYDWSTYRWCKGSIETMTKYCTKSQVGIVDNKTVLDPEDDIAHVNWGGEWRMPTDAEWKELEENCTSEWTKQNGVIGSKITSKKNGNSIFLPAAGYCRKDSQTGIGEYGLYFSASLNYHFPYLAEEGFFHDPDLAQIVIEYMMPLDEYPVFYGDEEVSCRCNGHSVRPVCGNQTVIKVTDVIVNPSSVSIDYGGTTQLNATVVPSNATNKGITWTSSDKSIATVSADGFVTAVHPGTATITVKTTDGGFTATCKVTVASSGPEYVDLGLSVKWATCNVGATKPEEYGDYYAWGETATKSDYSWSTYKWCKGSSSSLTKYYSGDKKEKLDLADDVACVKLGGKWRMPTIEEFKELKDNCTSETMILNGVNGWKFTSKKNGNSIFLPASSYWEGTSRPYGGRYGYYWSSSIASLYTNGPAYAWNIYFYFSTEYVSTWYYDRYLGHSVRPVTE